MQTSKTSKENHMFHVIEHLPIHAACFPKRRLIQIKACRKSVKGYYTEIGSFKSLPEALAFVCQYAADKGRVEIRIPEASEADRVLFELVVHDKDDGGAAYRDDIASCVALADAELTDSAMEAMHDAIEAHETTRREHEAQRRRTVFMRWMGTYRERERIWEKDGQRAVDEAKVENEHPLPVAVGPKAIIALARADMTDAEIDARCERIAERFMTRVRGWALDKQDFVKHMRARRDELLGEAGG